MSERTHEIVQRHREIDAAQVGKATAHVFIAMLESRGDTRERLVEAHRLLSSIMCSAWGTRPSCGVCGAPASTEVSIGCLDCREEKDWTRRSWE